MKDNLDFYQKLCQYRLTASVLYDKGKKNGLKEEELFESIKPLIDTLNGLIDRSVKDNLAGVIVAIKLLENEVEKHKKDAQFLLSKAHDTDQSIIRLKNSIKTFLKENHLTDKMDGDFWVTLVEEEVTVR